MTLPETRGNGAAIGIGRTTTRNSRQQAGSRAIRADPILLTIRWNLRKRSVFTAAALFSARINIVHVTWLVLVARARSRRAAIMSASGVSKRRPNKPGSKEISPDDANSLQQPQCVQPKDNR